MSIDFRQRSSAMTDHQLKQGRLVAEVRITANATPASKIHASDVPGSLYLRTEGKTAEADAVEDISSLLTNAANDVAGQFAVLLDDLDMEKIYSVSATPSTGTIAVVDSGVTPEGRLFVELDSSVSLAAANLAVVLVIEFKKKK